MQKILLILICLFLCATVCFAEIACVCDLEQCSCFIQFGDSGPEMEYIQHALIQQGFMRESDDASIFDERTLEAVLRFQEANGLSATGLLDDNTLTLLLWGMLPDALDQAQPLTNRKAIWIPTDGGIRRHVNPTCCKMLDPRRVSVRNADLMNMQPCGICNRGGKKEWALPE